ncbi:MAG: hypothetical protein L0H94_13265 [Nitrospira sp.]|nr:hypothetical protein [Nitrospira sp.]
MRTGLYVSVPMLAVADKAQYIHDDLGRLSQVINVQGNVATIPTMRTGICGAQARTEAQWRHPLETSEIIGLYRLLTS